MLKGSLFEAHQELKSKMAKDNFSPQATAILQKLSEIYTQLEKLDTCKADIQSLIQEIKQNKG